jgi:hypothetical protein
MSIGRGGEFFETQISSSMRELNQGDRSAISTPQFPCNPFIAGASIQVYPDEYNSEIIALRLKYVSVGTLLGPSAGFAFVSTHSHQILAPKDCSRCIIPWIMHLVSRSLAPPLHNIAKAL